MKYAEVIYETGSHAVVSVEDEKAFKDSLAEQQRRAMNGEPGGPHGQSAERIKQVLLYDEHPDDLHDGGLVSLSDLSAVAKSVAVGDQVSVEELRAALLQRVSPVDYEVSPNSRHASIYKAPHKDELNLDFLKDVK